MSISHRSFKEVRSRHTYIHRAKFLKKERILFQQRKIFGNPNDRMTYLTVELGKELINSGQADQEKRLYFCETLR